MRTHARRLLPVPLYKQNLENLSSLGNYSSTAVHLLDSFVQQHEAIKQLRDRHITTKVHIHM